jgi:hypothetical protein
MLLMVYCSVKYKKGFGVTGFASASRERRRHEHWQSQWHPKIHI